MSNPKKGLPAWALAVLVIVAIGALYYACVPKPASSQVVAMDAVPVAASQTAP